jgi:hypothetical protein
VPPCATDHTYDPSADGWSCRVPPAGGAGRGSGSGSLPQLSRANHHGAFLLHPSLICHGIHHPSPLHGGCTLRRPRAPAVHPAGRGPGAGSTRRRARGRAFPDLRAGRGGRSDPGGQAGALCRRRGRHAAGLVPHGVILAWGSVPQFCIDSGSVASVVATAEGSVLRKELRNLVRG